MSTLTIPPRVMMFKEGIPNSVRILLCLFFVISFQFSGGVYLSSVTQMYSSLALMQEDIMMAGYASFVGMTVVFPILFRLKFRFTSRTAMLVICPALILCNLITMLTDNVPLLVVTCFIAGALRMWGTFENLSSIQLNITPTRNFAVFFPVVYLIVLGSIQLSGLTTVYLSYWSNWHYMHWFIMGVLGIVWLCAALFTRHIRFAKPLPLYGIDWLGGALWAIFLLALIFVFVYGEHYDWFYSSYIRAAIVTALIALMLSINRMFTRRHPYISPETFRYKHTMPLLFLFLALCIFLATPNVLQNLFTGAILKYDPLNAVSLNWWNFLGLVIGCVWTYYWHVHCRGGYKVAAFVGFACIVGYQCMMYFLIDPRMNIEWLYLPTMLRGAGYIILYISLTVCVTGVVPFKHFFQFLALLGFIRTGVGSPLGSAIFNRWMNHLIPENMQLLTSGLDAVHPATSHIPLGGLYQEAMRQTLLVSIKEIYGWVCIVGLIFLLMILSYRYFNKIGVGRLPGMSQVRRILKRDSLVTHKREVVN